MSLEIQDFLSTFGDELRSKVLRLDNIIGRDHWLSVGNYKESLIRSFLRSTLPKRYEISTGFILSKSFNGELIKSRQIDIIIWDSTDYSAIFRDGEFVIVPPEACKTVIEVKGNLKLSDIEEAIESFDQLNFFLGVENNQGFQIARFIFAFDLVPEAVFPDSVLKKAAKTYRESKIITISDRAKYINEYWEKDKFVFDGIYILGNGFINTSVRMNESHEMVIMLRSFETDEKEYLYSLFETVIQSHLGRYSKGNIGMWYMDQPGLMAIKSTLKFRPTIPKSVIFVPPMDRSRLFSDVDPSIVIDDSFTKM